MNEYLAQLACNPAAVPSLACFSSATPVNEHLYFDACRCVRHRPCSPATSSSLTWPASRSFAHTTSSCQSAHPIVLSFSHNASFVFGCSGRVLQLFSVNWIKLFIWRAITLFLSLLRLQLSFCKKPVVAFSAFPLIIPEIMAVKSKGLPTKMPLNGKIGPAKDEMSEFHMYKQRKSPFNAEDDEYEMVSRLLFLFRCSESWFTAMTSLDDKLGMALTGLGANDPLQFLQVEYDNFSGLKSLAIPRRSKEVLKPGVFMDSSFKVTTPFFFQISYYFLSACECKWLQITRHSKFR